MFSTYLQKKKLKKQVLPIHKKEKKESSYMRLSVDQTQQFRAASLTRRLALPNSAESVASYLSEVSNFLIKQN